MTPTYVIAEAGACHDGDFQKMMALIDVAARAGADACKFQWTSDPESMASRRGDAVRDGYADVYRRYLAWDASWHQKLAAACKDKQIDYLCTVYLRQDIDVVAPHVAAFKVSSFEALDDVFVAAHLHREKDVLVSIGMAQKGELERSAAWCFDDDVTLMQCTSSYPAAIADLNLAVIGGQVRGFSDHSAPDETWTGALAVAAGARTIEAHIRLVDTAADNPDRPHAMTDLQFKDYVRHIRFAEVAMGESDIQRVQAEASMLRYRV